METLFSEESVLYDKTVIEMIDMLALMAGGHEASREKPRAIFDVCPAPPLIWSNFGAGNLIALARAGIPAARRCAR